MTLPPWLASLPATRIQSFDESAAIATPAGATETDVLSLVVPTGWKIFISGIAHGLAGNPPFDEGSGDLVWRVRLDQTLIRNFGNMNTSRGSVQFPRDEWVFANSGQRLRYTITNVGYAPIGTRTFVTLQGVFYQL